MTEVKKHSLIELSGFRQEAISLIERLEGEVDGAIEEYYEQVKRDWKTKIDSYSFQLDEFAKQAEYFKELAKDFQAKAKACEAAGQRLKDTLKFVMIESGETSFSGNIHSFKLAKAAPKLVIDESQLASQYHMIVMPTPKTEPDRQKIKEHLDAGQEVVGAKYEPVFSLRSGVAKLPKGK